MAIETGYQLAYSPIYDLTDDNINLWVDDINTDVAAHGGSIDTNSIGMTQMTINKMFNAPALEALGHTNDGTYEATVTSVDSTAVGSYLTGRGVDIGTITSTYMYTTYDMLTWISAVIALLTRDYLVTTTGDVNKDDGGGGVDAMQWNIDGVDVYIASISIDNGYATITMSAGDPIIYFVDGLVIVSANKTGRTDALYALYDSAWEVEEESLDFFLGTYVTDFQKIGTLENPTKSDKMIIALNNIFGFRHDDISESIEEMNNASTKTNVQDMWLTYAMPYELILEYLPSIASEMEAIYAQNNLTLSVDGVTLTYFKSMFDGPLGYSSIAIHGTGVLEVSNPLDETGTIGVPLLIPLNIINDLTIREKYVLKRYGLCFFSVVETKTKIAWYATKVFIAIAWFVAIILAAFFQQYWLFISMMKGGLIAGGLKIVGGYINDPVVLAILGLLIAVVTTDFKTLAGTALNKLTIAAQLAQKAGNIWFAYEQVGIQEELEAGIEENKEVQEAMQEYRKNAIYIDFSQDIENLFRTMYELPHEIYDALYLQSEVMVQLPQPLPPK